jgi:hypothetical protein
MPCYRCYFLDSEQHIVAYELLAHCVTDMQAQQAATSLLQQRRECRGVSVWDRARMVFEELVACVWLVGSGLADTLDAIGVFEAGAPFVA